MLTTFIGHILSKRSSMVDTLGTASLDILNLPTLPDNASIGGCSTTKTEAIFNACLEYMKGFLKYSRQCLWRVFGSNRFSIIDFSLFEKINQKYAIVNKTSSCRLKTSYIEINGYNHLNRKVQISPFQVF